MTVFAIKNTDAGKEYRGCGRAWAALQNNEVVSLRYMGDFRFDPTRARPAEAGVQSAYEACPALSHSRSMPSLSPADLGKVKQAAIAAGHPAVGPRGGHIPASIIAARARAILRTLEKEQFREYRHSSREQLSKLGDVRSGYCSCWEFVSFVG